MIIGSRRAVLRVGIAGVLLAGTAVASATGGSGASNALNYVGRVSVPVCGSANTFAIDSRQSVMLDLIDAGRACSSNTTVSQGQWLTVVDERSLRTIATLPVHLPGYRVVPGTFISTVRVAHTSRGDEMFVIYTRFNPSNPADPTNGTAIAVFDITGIRHHHGALEPRRTISVPGAMDPSTISTDDPTEFASSGVLAHGFYQPVPVDLTYDRATDSIDIIQRYHDPNGVNPQTSRRGTQANGIYIVEFAGASGKVRWAVHLGRCVDALGLGPYAPMLMRTRTDDGPVVAGGCLYNRSVTLGAGFAGGGKNGQGNGTALPTGGSMMAWTIQLHGDKLASPTAPVSYYPGRSGADTVVADRSDRRLFFTTLPATGSAANTPGAAAVVFDVDHERFVGAPTIAQPNEAGFALAATDGRYYSVGSHGISVGSARTTPLGQPNPAWDGYVCQTRGVMIDPKLRLLWLLPGSGCRPGDPGAVSGGTASYFEVVRDNTRLPAPEPAPDPDSYTVQKPKGPTQVSFSGSSDATGARVRLIGGLTGFLRGATFDGSDSIDSELASQRGAIQSAEDEVSQATGHKTPQSASYQQDFATHEIDVGVVQGASLSNFEASAQAEPASVDDTTFGQIRAAQSDTGHADWRWPFKGVSCSGEGNPSKSYGPNTGSSVHCDQAHNSVSASSTGEALDITTKLVNSAKPSATQAFEVSSTLSTATVHLDRKLGLISEVKAVARGVVVGPVRLGEIDATATCRAYGRAGTAGCTYKRTISGVSGLPADSPTSCTQTWDVAHRPPPGACDQLLAALNSVQPGFLVFAAPSPYWQRDELRGSPGGYQAVAERNFYDHLQDGVLNYDDSKQIPGLRVLYNNDGVKDPSRLDLQLANVKAESRYGISVAGPCNDCGGDTTQDTPVVDVSTPRVHPPVDTADLGETPSVAGASDSGGVLGGVVHLVRRAFAGLAWLVRSPGQALLVACLLTLLGAPVLLARRRLRLTNLGAIS